MAQQNTSLSKEVMQGIGLAVILIAIFILIGNQIAVATHKEEPVADSEKTAQAEPATKKEAPSAEADPKTATP